MKKLINTILILFLLAGAAYGQDTLRIQHPGSTQEHLEEIDLQELPEIIKLKLSGEDYSSWILQSAYKARHNKNAGVQQSDSTYYVVELKKEDETIRVWFDREGNQKRD